MTILHIFNPLQYKRRSNFVYPFSSGMNGTLHCISAALMDFIGIYLSKLFDFFSQRDLKYTVLLLLWGSINNKFGHKILAVLKHLILISAASTSASCNELNYIACF